MFCWKWLLLFLKVIIYWLCVSFWRLFTVSHTPDQVILTFIVFIPVYMSFYVLFVFLSLFRSFHCFPSSLLVHIVKMSISVLYLSIYLTYKCKHVSASTFRRKAFVYHKILAQKRTFLCIFVCKYVCRACSFLV